MRLMFLREAGRDAVAIRDGVAADAEGVVHAGLLFFLALRPSAATGVSASKARNASAIWIFICPS